MTVQPRRAAVFALLLVSLVLSLAACEKGMKVGDSWLVQPKQPLLATSFQLTRRTGSATKPNQSGPTQKLVIDLNTGRATFTDSDGKSYPAQLTENSLEELRPLIASREWQVGLRRSPSTAAETVNYALTVYDGDKAVKEQSVWSRPSQKPLPPSLKKLEDAFDQVERIAHPLSNDVDLLK